MLRSTITRRFVTAILLVSIVSLGGLGFFLLHFSYQNTLSQEKNALLLNARIIDSALQDKLWQNDPAIADIAGRISQETSLRITILDGNGKVLADTSEPAEVLDNHSQREEIRQALADGNGYGMAIRYSDTLHENLMYTAIPVYHKGRLSGIIRTATSLAPVEASYRQIRYSLLVALLAAMLASLSLAIWLAVHQLRPLLYMITTAQSIAQGDFTRRITLQTHDEFDSLGFAINKLTAALSEKIREAQAEAGKFALILEQMDNAVMLIDSQGNIKEANRRARELFSLQKEMEPHHSVHILGNAELSEKARQLLHTNETAVMTLQYDQHTFEVFLASFQDKSTPAVLAVFHDISVLQELNQRQSEFTGNAAHELATPLTSISGFAELLREDDFSSPEESRHYADVIYQQAQRMNRLIQDLLQLTRLESSTYRSQLPLQPVDGGKIMQAAAEGLRPKAAGKNQKLSLQNLAEGIKIKAVPDLLEQVLRNLVDNAIKYTPEGGTITMSCQVEKEQLVYTIQDNGMGIPAEALPRIFDRFYRVDKARSRKNGGNGIGLSLVKFLVEIFGGSLAAESQPGQGSTFRVSFPRL